MKKKPKRRSAVATARKPASPPRAEPQRRNHARRNGRVAESPAQDDRSSPIRDGRVPIVGIGASAGGLEAFTQLLRGLPKDTGMAFVLVQHLAPDHESMLTELVSKATSMPVTEVTEGDRVEPNHVYVIPPNRNMAIEDGVLHLAARTEPRGLHMPIDTFFTSLAAANRSQAIGVILSGTASDGALGLKAIKSEGGITVVQDPKNARYDGMPRAAIAAGAVDFVASIDRMGAELAKIARHPYLARTTAEEAEPPGEEEHIVRIFALVRAATGVDFTYYKRATVNRRMRRRMALHKLERLHDYVRLLQQDPAEVERLCQDVFIHVTGFFRDPEMFETLKETVFPQLVKRRRDAAPFRIWISGCSTGEEAYSFAIALLESIGPGTSDGEPAFQIFATDISTTAVDRARAGFYPETIAADVSADRLRRFFQRVDGGYRVLKSIRDLCVFARQDVTKDPPFSKLDLISCRNLLIYLGPILQKRVLQVFHYALNPGGYLVLGTSETIGPHSDLFMMNDRRYKVFVRKGTAMRGNLDFRSDTGETANRGRRPTLPARIPADLQGHVERLLLEEYAPAAVLVNSDMQIAIVHGETGRYLRPARGEASLSVLKMAREGLMIELRTAIHAAQRRSATVRKQGLRVKQNGHMGSVDLEVTPVTLPGVEKHYLVVFRDGVEPAPLPPASKSRQAGARVSAAKSDAVRKRLEEELKATRDYLQSIIQDQEATNEEIQSANEEILSSNEELQSTNEELETAKEELQSTNEELNTVNEELQTRNQELSLLNSDLSNLLASVQIPIIMVANNLRIRRFTPTVDRIFSIIGRDVDRPIGDLKSNLQLPNLERLITEAIDTVSVREQDVQDLGGRWYTMRIRPYKNLDNRIDGAVLTFLDIDTMKRNVDDTDRSGLILEAMARVVTTPVVVLDSGLRVREASRAFYRQFKLSPQEAVGQPFFALGGGCWDSPRARALLEDLVRRETRVEEYGVLLQDGTSWVLNVVAVGEHGDDGRFIIMSCTETKAFPEN